MPATPGTSEENLRSGFRPETERTGGAPFMSILGASTLRKNMKREDGKPKTESGLQPASKALARPPQDRAMRSPFTRPSALRPPASDPTRRRPNSLSRQILPLLALAFGLCLPMKGSTITGTILDTQNNPLTTTMVFYPTNAVIVSGSTLSAGAPVPVVTTNGNLSVTLAPGYYVVSFPLIPWRTSFVILVPNDSNTYTIISRIVSGTSAQGTPGIPQFQLSYDDAAASSGELFYDDAITGSASLLYDP